MHCAAIVPKLQVLVLLQHVSPGKTLAGIHLVLLNKQGDKNAISFITVYSSHCMTARVTWLSTYSSNIDPLYQI